MSACRPVVGRRTPDAAHRVRRWSRAALWLVLLVPFATCRKRREEAPSPAPAPLQVAAPPRAAPPAVPAPSPPAELPAEAPEDTPDASAGLPSEPGPHPDYPTPVAAGTKDLFLLEEPVRGPHVTEVRLPAAPGLAWTESAHAQLDAAGFALSAAEPPRGGLRWRVGRENGLVRLVEQLRPGGGAVSRWVLEWSASDPPKLRTLATLDAYGTLVEARSYEPAGERYTARLLSGANALPGCGAQQSVVDTRGLASETRCLAWHGTPIYDTSGVRMRRFERDEAGFVVAETRFGADDLPIADQSGIHRTTFERDEAGRVLRTRTFALDGTPVRSSADGCFGRAREYDARGFVVAETCLDADGKPTADPDGIATTSGAFDPRGCRVADGYLDPAGRPTVDDAGVARRVWTVDDACTPLTLVCHGRRDALTPCVMDGAPSIAWTLDDLGRVVSARSWLRPDVPGTDADYGVFEQRMRYDQLGRRVELSCHGPDGGNLLCHGTGFHAALTAYDEAGRTVEQRFLCVDRSPADNLGTSIRRYEYDSYDHLSVLRELDLGGRPFSSYGMASRRHLYDQGHRQFAVLLYHRDERPASFDACFVGLDCPEMPWHALRIVRSSSGKVTENLFFDAAGQRIAVMDCTRRRCWD
ncbi:MAG: hypothetical protein HY905_16760 [Deltaproteobacteria bacterium]|nr:hypothetical protein [Deltaproteobacteria bacterium]